MNFYIATSLRNADRARSLARRLTELGHKLTYDWTVHGSVNDTPEIWSQTARREVDGVRRAHVVIVLLPGGQGTHVELGVALGSHTPVIVVGDDRPLAELGASHRCIFYDYPSVERIPTIGRLRDAIEADIERLVSEVPFLA
mgnify:CR=1 FL=1